MTTTLKIDFVSDVSCPWCAIGLKSLEQALAGLDGQIAVKIHFQPFELNPQMGSAGQDIAEHLGEKYGLGEAQLAQNREVIRQRGAEVGFAFGIRNRIYNTFDAHRLLHWAGLEGRQLELKHALFKAYFTDGEDPSDHSVLQRLVVETGLDTARAAAILAGDEFADEVRAQERFFQQNGIHSVPAVIINDRHLISGGQPPAVFGKALQEILAA
ncbi:DsbA family oxidoreductase [Chitinimonas sp. BJB300]|uniref:DsbA family oxidoreductase n=1 Tax=Chitinimonas sp. BJB300 TaxID=1559339 RepID=UPI000C0D4A69|nr:DsbA family oxidoreductase [Chitinimonas sp. BJB300]PHV10404.1 disulfide bond formation protein DsbA [Chitinimonas sp. BJB300]TSJ83829.1 DsbA family oxidoreductase [Chitinimonas sp. BJB300]